MFAKCTYADCKKANECKRFLESQNGAEYEFKNICTEENNFRWFVQVDNKIENKKPLIY
jgi:hypothetical protein